ncbi:RDD family protein [Micromonospora sp. HM5-17]|jgi:uncharacterized RDD family membrane protein YckC|uniref:RDD family protein n=1 Tax=Micromonospora sp. HM5-17 TaxID=2487710 RepID=UPI000F48FEA5|nr:RDD family protein [Micromonospora sp. HM5-17]ROT31249.1 RDD family protein [Micromonospora sp. HM5-17]
MTDQQRIDDYADEVVRRLVASPDERRRRRAELVGHLTDAAEAGELAAALDRLGSPESAARSFAAERTRPLAPTARRFAAVALDNLPLIGVTVALLVVDAVRVLNEGGGFAATFPPIPYVEIGDVCVTAAPLRCGDEAYPGAGPFRAIGVPIALCWSILGLGILESRTGTTPGKRLLRLRVVTEDGLRVTVGSALLRRLSFLLGPLAWLDWVPLLWGDRRRLLDRVSGTKVVSDG